MVHFQITRGAFVESRAGGWRPYFNIAKSDNLIWLLRNAKIWQIFAIRSRNGFSFFHNINMFIAELSHSKMQVWTRGQLFLWSCVHRAAALLQLPASLRLLKSPTTACSTKRRPPACNGVAPPPWSCVRPTWRGAAALKRPTWRGRAGTAALKHPAWRGRAGTAVLKRPTRPRWWWRGRWPAWTRSWRKWSWKLRRKGEPQTGMLEMVKYNPVGPDPHSLYGSELWR